VSSIQNAKFVRLAERCDKKYLDVEVHLQGRETPLLASFALNGGKPELANVFSKDASRTVDWYDNNLHDAYVDLTTEMFDNGRGELFLGSRDDFTRTVLSWPDVRSEIAPYVPRNWGDDTVAFLSPDGEVREYERP
jgi:hypothetical protein